MVKCQDYNRRIHRSDGCLCLLVATDQQVTCIPYLPCTAFKRPPSAWPRVTISVVCDVFLCFVTVIFMSATCNGSPSVILIRRDYIHVTRIFQRIDMLAFDTSQQVVVAFMSVEDVGL